MPIAGRKAAPVASSCNDMLAGLSKNEILRTPPDFCASAESIAKKTFSNDPTDAIIPACRCMTTKPPSALQAGWPPVSGPFAGLVALERIFNGGSSRRQLFIEPDVFEAPAVVDAVHHDR